MSDKNTGGPAFPSSNNVIISEDDIGDYVGMTLRDYFAAHAPEMPDWFRGGEKGSDDYASWAYRYAEEMLERRAK